MEILDKWYTDHVDDSLPTETSLHFAPDFVGPLEAFWHVPLTKLMLLAPPDRMMKVRKMIAAKFNGQASFAISDEQLRQVIHLDVDKAAAVARVAQAYEIPRERVMAIGDAPNDVGMIKWAGLGVAMGNGWDAAHKVADVIVPTNDEDGVAFALKRYVLGI
jgi:HAD superfamily hydrolase (TIGR01484 family)